MSTQGVPFYAHLATAEQLKDINAVVDQCTVLFHVIRSDKLEPVRYLVEQCGADLNVLLGQASRVTYMYAIECTMNPAVVRYAMANGACCASLERLLSLALCRSNRTAQNNCEIARCLSDAGYRHASTLPPPAWFKSFVKIRNLEKRCIVTVLGSWRRSPLLMRVGRDVTHLIGLAMWAMRKEFVE